MADLIKKQKRQIEELLAERKKLRDQVIVLPRIQAQLDDAIKQNAVFVGMISQLNEDVTLATHERSEARAELASARALANETMTKLHKALQDLQVEKQATEALDKEVASLKKRLEYENSEGITQTRRRLKDRGDELEQVRREMSVKEGRIKELERLVKKHETDAKLFKSPSDAGALGETHG